MCRHSWSGSVEGLMLGRRLSEAYGSPWLWKVGAVRMENFSSRGQCTKTVVLLLLQHLLRVGGCWGIDNRNTSVWLNWMLGSFIAKVNYQYTMGYSACRTAFRYRMA